MWNPRSELTTRWTAAERKRINAALARGAWRFLDDLPTVAHGRVAYVDLRGFPFAASILADLRRVDLSDCNMEMGGVHRKVRLTECLFRGARLWAAVGHDVRRCDFTRAHMKGASLRGAFRDCTFADANLVGARCDPGARFVRCDFAGARLRNASFDDALFDRCDWDGATIGDGTFVGTKFLHSRPTDAQFGESLMESDVDEATEREILAEIKADKRARRVSKGRVRRR